MIGQDRILWENISGLMWYNHVELIILALTWTYLLVKPLLAALGFIKLSRSSESIERYKAHLVIKGYTHQKKIDFIVTFSPIVKNVKVHLLLAVIAVKGWSLFKLDVNNASYMAIWLKKLIWFFSLVIFLKEIHKYVIYINLSMG